MAQPRGTWPGDLHVKGILSFDGIEYPTEKLGNEAVDPADPLEVNKVRQQVNRLYTQSKGAAVATVTGVVQHLALTNGSLDSVQLGLLVASTGAATIVVDLKKNGVTVLTAPVTLNSTHAAYTIVTAGIAGGGGYLADDIFELTVTATAGGGVVGQGLFVNMTFREGSG